MRLDSHVAMITGAARGLGRSHALTFAHEGCDLLLVDRCQEDGPYTLASRRQLEDTAGACRRIGARVETAVADVRCQDQIDQAVDTGMDAFGRMDVLVNNAGLLTPGGVRTHELSEDDWALVIDVNLNGTWRCCRAVLPHMVGQRSGSIVNTASTGAKIAFELFSSYTASKHAVVGLTKTMALEYGRYGIRANALCPSTVAADPAFDSESTAAVAAAMSAPLDQYEGASAALHASGRLVTAAEVSAGCLWLASPESAGVTGTELYVDGGFTAR